MRCLSVAGKLPMPLTVMDRTQPHHGKRHCIIVVMGVNETGCATPFAWGLDQLTA